MKNLMRPLALIGFLSLTACAGISAEQREVMAYVESYVFEVPAAQLAAQTQQYLAERGYGLRHRVPTESLEPGQRWNAQTAWRTQYLYAPSVLHRTRSYYLNQIYRHRHYAGCGHRGRRHHHHHSRYYDYYGGPLGYGPGYDAQTLTKYAVQVTALSESTSALSTLLYTDWRGTRASRRDYVMEQELIERLEAPSDPHP